MEKFEVVEESAFETAFTWSDMRPPMVSALQGPGGWSSTRDVKLQSTPELTNNEQILESNFQIVPVALLEDGKPSLWPVGYPSRRSNSHSHHLLLSGPFFQQVQFADASASIVVSYKYCNCSLRHIF